MTKNVYRADCDDVARAIIIKASVVAVAVLKEALHLTMQENW